MSTSQEAAAKRQIAEVLVRYASGIDRRDWELFRSCFTADVRADYQGVAVWHGVDAIADYMQEAHAGMGHTMHRLSNIDIQVDGARATSRTYVDAILMAEDGGSGLNPIGFYDDVLLNGPEGWRISERRFTPVAFKVV